MIKGSSFYTLNIEEDIKELETRKEEIKLLNDKIATWNAKADKIRKQFDFFIPNYLIDEIIEKEIEKNYSNLHCLCNMAFICGRITKEESQMIKKVYP